MKKQKLLSLDTTFTLTKKAKILLGGMMPKRKRELTTRYKISQPDKYKISIDCKHVVNKMVGGKDSVLVSGKCSKCGAKVYQDRASWLEEKKRRGI